MNKHHKPLVSLAVYLSFSSAVSYADTDVDVYLNTEHRVGGVSEFDRSKFVTVHSSLLEGDWDGEDDKLDYLLSDLDAYFGRDNGHLRYNLDQADEDMNRAGFVDPNWIVTEGQRQRTEVYGERLERWHKYDNRQDVMIGGQWFNYWYDTSTSPAEESGKSPWAISGSKALGEFTASYFNEFYRDDDQLPSEGSPRPKLFEVINEPILELTIRAPFRGAESEPPERIFEFHNEIADEIRSHESDILVGGYTAAFPVFDFNDFQGWEFMMKPFVDISAEKMDFFSIHFYDFHNRYDINSQPLEGEENFKGSRLEATFDMVEQYSMLAIGETKPYVISEYGGRDSIGESSGSWTPERDWHLMKGFSPMMLQFMARPNDILKAIPFSLMKATWYQDPVSPGTPYDWRLMRQAHEMPGEEGDDWVFTELIKFYELWSDVNGIRVETQASDPDVLVDSYVDDDKSYVILNNLNYDQEVVNLSVKGITQDNLKSIKIKNLYLDTNINKPVLKESQLSVLPEQFVLEPEATLIVEYETHTAIELSDRIDEKQYYADKYLQPIVAEGALEFNIDGLQVDMWRDAILRLSFSRSHSLSKQPLVSINGTMVDAPLEIAGDDQVNRAEFFGMLEIPLDVSLLAESNRIAIQFPDEGGYVTSVTLQGFELTDIANKEEPEDLESPSVEIEEGAGSLAKDVIFVMLLLFSLRVLKRRILSLRK
ncbi:hypothetical protein [Agaribacterium sp. ZY112]|uniref:hypothetical protein n=1 Tax=Agaribacterium sp. ZY112 TaxID=3233574 RepID=UPI003523A67C